MAGLVKALKNAAALRRVLEEPKVIEAVQSLSPAALNQLVAHVGLEDAGELLCLASAEQLKGLLDLDLWRNARPGAEEKFDSERFTVWLEVLLDMGVAFAAEKVAEMDEDFLSLALTPHILVLDLDELSTHFNMSENRRQDEYLEKALEGGLSHEFDAFRVISRNVRSWDSVLNLLAELSERHSDLLQRLLARACRISAEYIDDQGGLYEVLTAEEQVESDVAFAREQRREAAGYVSPLTAASFFDLVRVTPLNELRASARLDPVSRSYFRVFDIERAPPPQTGGRALQAALQDVPAFRRLLTEAGLGQAAASPRVLTLQARNALPRHGALPAVIAGQRENKPEAYARSLNELNYLANALVAGAAHEGRTFLPAEAADAVMAVAALGLEDLVQGKIDEPTVAREGLIKPFRIGWWILHHELVLPAAKSVGLLMRERNISGHKLFQEAIQKGKPWLAIPALEGLEEHSAHRWARRALLLVQECPAYLAPGQEPRFVCSRQEINQQLAWLSSVVRGDSSAD